MARLSNPNLSTMNFKVGVLLLMFVTFAVYGLSGQEQEVTYVMTVNGKLGIDEMGKTLIHEHIVTNFNGTENPNQHFSAENRQKAIELILPYLDYLKKLGYKTLVECTPSFIGKNADLLKELSKRSGIHIITNTGYYSAVDKKYLPERVYSKTAQSLAEEWISEWNVGISNTGIKPGFIKLGVGNGALDSIEEKIIKAGFLTSEKTGLSLAVHTGDGESIRSQYQLGIDYGFDWTKYIWVHAQNGTDGDRIAMAENGIWISLDGVSEPRIENYISMIVKLKEHTLLSKLLLSHDDGWSVDSTNAELQLELFENGNKQPYSTIPEILVPKLREIGFTEKELDLIFIENPKRALGVLNK